MNPQPITITFLSRTHTIPAYDAEGLEYRLKIDSQLELRLYRLNRGWMARLDFALPEFSYVQSHRNETAQAAVDEIERELVPLAETLLPLTQLMRNRGPARDAEPVHIASYSGIVAAYEAAQANGGELPVDWFDVPRSEPPSCDEPTVEMSQELLAEALQGG